MNTPVAIRSLMCKDHALNIPPTNLSVIWFIGKRCNYDCSYCSPHTHDAISPFINQTSAKDFAKRLLNDASINDKKINWVFTGGEPFIDPGFVPLVSFIRSFNAANQINVTTNGSLPLSVYLGVENLFTGITISLHLERSTEEINETVKKIIHLTKKTKLFINVNLMFLPGRQSLVKDLISVFKKNNVKFVLRRIIQHDFNNQYSSSALIVGPGKKDRVLFSIETQKQQKELWKKENFQGNFDQRNKDVYNESEKTLLEVTNSQTVWNNIGVWFDDENYQEINTDLLIGRQTNRFKNWSCFAGVDQLYIEFDGTVYAGVCQSGGALGHISDGSVNFQFKNLTCSLDICACNTDISVRKSKPGLENLITNG